MHPIIASFGTEFAPRKSRKQESANVAKGRSPNRLYSLSKGLVMANDDVSVDRYGASIPENMLVNNGASIPMIQGVLAKGELLQGGASVPTIQAISRPIQQPQTNPVNESRKTNNQGS